MSRATRADAAPPVDIDPIAARAGLRGRRIGPHVPIRDGLPRAAERARLVGASAVQVFAGDPRAWRARAEPLEHVERFRELLDEWDIRLVVHASYLVNLASPDAEVHARSIERMRHELAAAAALGAEAVNAHVGSHRRTGVAAGVERTADAIARILDDRGIAASKPPVRLVLEVAAGQGDSLGVTTEELGAILDAAGRRGVDPGRLGICLDTAHLWSAGLALDDPVAVDRLLVTVDAVLGPDALAMVHLNDSRAARGSRNDRHEHLGDGRIGTLGLGHLVRHPRLTSVPVILETPGMETGWDAVNMARVRSLLAADPLAAGADAAAGPLPVRRPGGASMHILGSAPEPA